jgi:hypothetical protein
MEIIGRIDETGTSVAGLARRVGIDPERTAAFIDAERCEPDVLTRLCAHFGLAPPEGCPRMALPG